MEKKKQNLDTLPQLTNRSRNDETPHSTPSNSPLKSRRIRVAIAMSGGVDSSVAAKMLVDQGHEVVGFMMKLWSDPTCPTKCPRENACCDEQGVIDAKKVADQLGIPFYLVNAKEVFKKEVTDYFINEYKNLRTPNPCVVCNEKIKFGWLLDFAKSVGCDYLATGHYARIVCNLPLTKTPHDVIPDLIRDPELDSRLRGNDKGVYSLLKAKDELKDQSYFLYRLTQEQLSKIIFPLGEYRKPEVRDLAKKWGLPVFEKRESQEICFIQDKDFREFLKRNISEDYFKPGNIVDLNGRVLGQHNGLINYTIGQRKGIDQAKGISQEIRDKEQETNFQDSNKSLKSKFNSGDKSPLYVVGFNKIKNQLIVGEDKEVYQNEMKIEDLHFIGEKLKAKGEKLMVKIRYRHPAVSCRLESIASSKKGKTPKQAQHEEALTVRFEKSQRAITPGQSAVLYNGDEVVGGGIIK